ncbi:MAG: TonB-dependent receptor [Bacteroidota bacterium]
MKKHIFNVIIGICLTLIHLSVVAQQQIVVLDEETSRPIGEVLVTWQGGQSISGDNGLIDLPANITSIVISRTGYFSTELTTESEFPNRVFLTPDNLFNEIEITAYPSNSRSLTAPTSYTLISKNIVSSANELDFSNVLNNVPGLFMQNGTLGTNRITIRGIGARTPFGTNKIRAYFNEIPLTAGDGETSLEDNELSTIGLIEVIRGPSATAYGAGLAGLLKLSPSEIKGNSFSSTYGIGSFGLSRTRQQLQLTTDQHSINAAYATTFSDGYRENNQYDRQNLLLNYQYKGNRIQVDFLGTFIDVKSFIPSSLNETDFNESPQSAAGNWAAVRGFEDYTKGLMGLTVTAELSDNQKLSGTVFNTFRNNYELRPFGILTENSVLYGSRWKYSNEISSLLSFVLGGEYSIENYENTTLDQEDRVPTDLTSFNNQRRKNFNLFAETQWQVSRSFELIGGLNFSRLSYDLTDLFRSNGDQSGNYEFDPILSPRLFAGYRINENHRTYFQLSHGFSAPSVEETLTPDGLINNEIQPETGLNYELGFKGNFGDSGFSYEINGYRMNVKNLLVARRTAEDQFIGINAGETLHEGLEMELNYRYGKPDRFLLRPFVNLSITSVEFVDFIDLDDDFSGNRLPGVPGFVGNFGVFIQASKHLKFSTIYRSVGEMYLRDDNVLKSPGYSLVNIKADYRIELGKFLIKLDAGINNLLDTEYASQILINAGSFGGRAPRYFYPGNPRNYFTNVTLQYVF